MLLGENIQLGVGKESTRGTAVAPTHWLRGRVPTSLKVVLEKALIKETKGTRANSQDSIITAKRVEGEFEFNVRNATIGYFLLSLLGSVTSEANADASGDVYDHTFAVDVDAPEAPTLTAAVARGAEQHYRYNMMVVSSLQLRAVLNDLVNATVSLIGKDEEEVSAFTPAFPDDDHVFPRQGVSVKVADNVAGLAGATAVCLTELNLNIANGARAKQCLGTLTPQDVIALMVDVNGSFTMDFADTDMYDWYKAGTAKAMQITITNTAETIGTAANPSIVITLPKVTLESYDEDRPIDDITNESLDFVAHWDDTEGYQVQVVATNEEASY